jgi:thiamine biosynthesis lipoprotein
VFVLLTTLTPASAAVFRTGQPVMGTVLQVTVVAADDPTARTLAEAAVAEARRWDDILTTWRPEGELARLNMRAGGGAVLLGPELSSALRAMQRLSAATDGAFDPAVGPIVDLWRGPAPPPAARAASAAPLRMATALVLDGQLATLAAGAKLDTGGIGKGMALDAAAAMLRARGVQAAYLDFGGSSQLAIGAPPGAPEGWRVAVSGLAPNRMLGVLSLRDAALSTSRAAEGPSEAGPIVDPRSGSPVIAARITTVRAADATSAEAWSKAMIIRGRDGMQQARAGGLDVLLEDQDGVVRSPGFTLEPLP